jgi:YidC/Oxa1 family membrane protein insertase
MRRNYYLLFTIYYFLFTAGGVITAAEETAPLRLASSKASTTEAPVLKAADFTSFDADNAPPRIVTLGSTDPNSGFKFELELTSKGAAISTATLSEFDNRDPDPEERQKLVILSPVKLPDDSEVLSMSNKEFVFVQQQLQLPLDKLYWQSFDIQFLQDGSQTARFEATIKGDNGSPVIKLIKTYKVIPDSFLLDCELTIENLTSTEQKVRFNLTGPLGIGKEDPRSNDRKIIGGFITPEGKIVPSKTELVIPFPINLLSKNAGLKQSVLEYEKALLTHNPTEIEKAKRNLDIARNLPAGDKGSNFLWAAITNKYFAAILNPVPSQDDANYCDWIKDKTSWFYNPDGDTSGSSGDETVGIKLTTMPAPLAPAGQTGCDKHYKFRLYLGPKDKSLFDKNDMYRNLGFAYTIDFMSCCCPACIIQPLAFGILAIMKWMYGFIGNYGVVIIILVFLMRLIMHPITKKSQVSMSKMQKVLSDPQVQEIRKKYSKTPMEMQRRIAAFQKEHGVSQASGIISMLPMFVQMPIWVALYSSIYASIDLRGAAFLPFWITDLSAPDALFRFKAIAVPLLGKLDSLNLLPILMGIAFYLQQKFTSAPSTSTDPQVAQQQKMMMIMFPVLFPLMLYTSPSGLNLYIMTSTFFGVIEQYVIKKHIREKEEAESKGLVAVTSKTGGKVKKKKPKPFFRT